MAVAVKFDLTLVPAYSPSMAVKKRIDSAAPHSPLAERIWKQRGSDELEVSLDRLEAELEDVSRYDIVASLKELEKAGKGQFTTARKGQRSRFVWGETASSAKKPPTSNAAASKAPPSKALPSKALPSKGAAGKASASAANGVSSKEPSSKGLSSKASDTATPAPVPRLSSTEPLAKAMSRKELVPAGKGLSRPKLSVREASEPVARISRRLQHSFHLRPGVQVTIELPEDVTATEVDRFCNFLRALPFAGSLRRS